MTIDAVKRAMLNGTTVRWNGHTYTIYAMSVKPARLNKSAPTEPFYYTLTLQDTQAKYSLCEVLLGEVEPEGDT